MSASNLSAHLPLLCLVGVSLALALGGCSSSTPADTQGPSGTSSSADSSGVDSVDESDTSSEVGTDESSADETGTDAETGEAGCHDVAHSIVADIDETLTTSDGEFILQLVDSTHDPEEREGASEMIQAYHDLGYSIVYLTARAYNQSSSDEAMIPAEDLTRDWLEAHGFPVDENTRLEMSDTFVFGASAAQYKTERLGELQDEGVMFEYAYGNAGSDITAYDNVGIPKEVTFIIGESAGDEGTVAIEGEGWVDHIAAHLPSVMDWCADD